MKNEAAIGASALNHYLDDFEAAKLYVANSQSGATLRAYRSDWEIFTTYCEDHNLPSLPSNPVVVAQFLASQAQDGLKVKTIERRIAAIADFHTKAGYAAPSKMEGSAAITAVMKGIKRVHGSKVEKKTPATDDIILKLLESIKGDEIADYRDRAVLAFGLASAMRRSEISDVEVEDLRFTEDGVIVSIKRSKSDQDGEGQIIAVPHGKYIRPVERLVEWLDIANITSGPVFRPLTKSGKVRELNLSGNAIAEIIKKRCYDAGLDPKKFSGHSLRSGFITSAARQNASLSSIMQQSRHKSVDVAMDYIQESQVFKDHSGKDFL